MNTLKQIAQGYTNLIKKGLKISQQEVEELAADRWGTCLSCEHLSKAKHCKLCGCYMPAKTRTISSKCPAGKW